MTTALAILEEGTRMLAEARTFDEVRKVRAFAKAAQVYAVAHGLGVEAQNYAGMVVVEADIRRAEMIREGRKRGDLISTRGGKPAQNGQVSKLADIAVSYKQSAAAEALLAEAATVRAWMANTKASRGLKVTEGRAARVAREAAAAKKRAARPVPSLPATCDLRLGDFREVLTDVPDASLDVILTDPPYPAKFLPLWSDLAVFAKRTLKPTGMLVAMSGQANLPDVMARLGEHLPYRWLIAYLMGGGANVVHARKVSTMWKPILVYGASDRRLFDVARSDREDKEHHAWGQSERGMADLLRLVADAGQTICDPFVGGGTVPLVALAAGCSFVGAEQDADAYATARERVANA